MEKVKQYAVAAYEWTVGMIDAHPRIAACLAFVLGAVIF